MDRQSQYDGKTLTTIARELILELFAGQTASKDEIERRVIEVFRERGGKESEIKTMKQRVSDTLGDLSSGRFSRFGYARYLRERKSWRISSGPETHKASVEPSLRPERTIGSGNGYVYVYSYPTYQSAAESKGKIVWACKVGKTVNDPTFRVKEQVTGMPESPKIYLAIQTNKPELLEKIIHNILDFCGKKKLDSPGTEWFITSPSEVEDIYQRNFGDSQ